MTFHNHFLLFMLMGLSKHRFSDALQMEVGESMTKEVTSDRVSELEKQIEKQQKEIDDLRSYVKKQSNAQAREISYILEDVEILKEGTNKSLGTSRRKNRVVEDEIHDIKTDIVKIKRRTKLCNKNVKHLENEIDNMVEKLTTTVRVSSTLQALVMNFKETLNTHTDEAETFREDVENTWKILSEEFQTVKDSLFDVEIRIEENENAIHNQNQTLYEAIISENQKVGAIKDKLDVIELSLTENFNTTRDSLLKHQERSEVTQKENDKRLIMLATDINVQNLGIETLANSFLNQIAYLNSSLRMVNATLYQNQNEIKYMNDKFLASENVSIEVFKNYKLDVENVYEVLNSTQEQVANLAFYLETSESVPDNESLEDRVRNVENLVDALNTEELTINIIEMIENNKKNLLEAIQENIENKLSNQTESDLEEFNKNITLKEEYVRNATLIERVLEGLTKWLGVHTKRLDTIESKVHHLDINDIKTDIAEIKYRTTSCNESVDHLEDVIGNVLEKLRTTDGFSSTLQAHAMNFKEALNTHTDEAEIIREDVQNTLKILSEDIQIVKDSLFYVEIRIEENENTIDNLDQTLYEAIITESHKVGTIKGKLDVIELSLIENFNITRNSLLKHQERSEAIRKETDKRLMMLATDIHVHNLATETLSISLLNQIAHLNSSLEMANATLYQNQNEINYINDTVLASENVSLEASKNHRYDVENLYKVMNSTQEQVANWAVFMEALESVPDNEGLEDRIRNVENLVDALNTEEFTINITERIENNKKHLLEAIQENIENELSNQIESKLEEFNKTVVLKGKYDRNITLTEEVLEGLTQQLGSNTERLDKMESKVLQFENKVIMCRIQIGNLSNLIRDHAENASRDWSSMLQVKEKLRMLETDIQHLPELKTQIQQQGLNLNELRSQVIDQQTEPPTSTTFVPPYQQFDFGIFNNNPSQHISRYNQINPLRPNGRPHR